MESQGVHGLAGPRRVTSQRRLRHAFVYELVNYGEWGQQMHNDYRATTAGIEEAARARDMRGDAS